MSAEYKPHSELRNDFTLVREGMAYHRGDAEEFGHRRVIEAYEALDRIEEQLETLRGELQKVRNGEEVIYEENISLWAAGVLALSESNPASNPDGPQAFEGTLMDGLEDEPPYPASEPEAT